MKVNDIINETTSSGAIASVSTPLLTQKHSEIGKGVYDSAKPGNLLKGKKTSKKYANSVNETATLDKNQERFELTESKMKQVAVDMQNMDNGNFKKKYGKTKEQLQQALGNPDDLFKLKDNQSLNDLKEYTGETFRVQVTTKDGQKFTHSVKADDEEQALKKVHMRTYKNGHDDFDMQIIDESTKLDEEDKIIAPDKGKKLKTGLHKPGDEKKLSHFKHPFKSSGIHISDSRGNKVGEFENEDVAKEVCKAINDYVKMDEAKVHENVERVGAFNTTSGILKLLKNSNDPKQFFLINPKGEVVQQFRGSEEEVKAQVQREIKSTVHENKGKK